ncbi:PP2C family protein-serine/threonine phosphatase [uncultured Roseobacter sp.]|uniref:PP2C family protein-serine/threonine phosphatase n=1 Tax=uncultured Roseobacter sp. TaxID=114847 RepID=UPI002630160C|nr:fused response regulator/phosphatase [uncultured Roseobacter sp.]
MQHHRAALRPATPSTETAEPPRILVVDDSRLQRKILTSSLQKWGYEVIEAASGEEALALCETHAPQMILSDWMMPGMSGIEFCTAFRALAGDAYGYFILLTSKSEKEAVAQGLDAGADDFLTKPVNAPELRARLTAGLRILDMQRELTQKNRVITETLDELQRLYDALDSDLIEAKQLQQSLVPERFRQVAGGNVSLLLRSSGHVGGDLVGFFPGGPDHLCVYSIDVSGHGVSSALMTARLAGYLSASALDQNVALTHTAGGYVAIPPVEAVERLNALVLDEMETAHYFTMVLADIDCSTGEVRFAQAGHPHPVIQRADGRIVQEGPGGFPVGLMPGAVFGEGCLQLDPGDRLVVLSDGFTECPDPQDVLLGEDGLGEMLTGLQAVQSPELLDALVARLTEFAGHDAFPDDLSGAVFAFTADQVK